MNTKDIVSKIKTLPLSLLFLGIYYLLTGLASMFNIVMADGGFPIKVVIGMSFSGLLLIFIGYSVVARKIYGLWALKLLTIFLGIVIIIIIIGILFDAASTQIWLHHEGQSSRITTVFGVLFLLMIGALHLHAAYGKKTKAYFDQA